MSKHCFAFQFWVSTAAFPKGRSLHANVSLLWAIEGQGPWVLVPHWVKTNQMFQWKKKRVIKYQSLHQTAVSYKKLHPQKQQNIIDQSSFMKKKRLKRLMTKVPFPCEVIFYLLQRSVHVHSLDHLGLARQGCHWHAGARLTVDIRFWGTFSPSIWGRNSIWAKMPLLPVGLVLYGNARHDGQEAPLTLARISPPYCVVEK